MYSRWVQGGSHVLGPGIGTAPSSWLVPATSGPGVSPGSVLAFWSWTLEFSRNWLVPDPLSLVSSWLHPWTHVTFFRPLRSFLLLGFPWSIPGLLPCLIHLNCPSSWDFPGLAPGVLEFLPWSESRVCFGFLVLVPGSWSSDLAHSQLGLCPWSWLLEFLPWS